MQTLVLSFPFIILPSVVILSVCMYIYADRSAMERVYVVYHTVFVNFTGSTDKGPKVQLYKNGTWSEDQGVVLVKYNNKWNFINGSDWNYTDALVVCRELGKYCIQRRLSITNSVYYIQFIVKILFGDNLNFGDQTTFE